jgi:16S rRNA (guanine(966)-N(2))-methyltransferase RsmD
MRVIAGQLGGRVLKAPSGNQTRPTADRVREGLFSMLGRVDGFSVLDLYAGTGALGIEALSRGAQRAVFVESAASALKCLGENLASLALTERCIIVRRSVERAQRELVAMGPFDLVFCDPPWRAIETVWRMLGKLEWKQWLSPEGQLVLEHPASSITGISATDLEVTRSRAWGDSAITLLHRCSSP